jgi:hypothetical protein
MAGYTRTDTTNNIADGNIINATDLDNEFDGIQAAFNSSTGHNHDGTTGEGAPILVLGPTQDVVVGATTVTPKTTNTVDIGSSSLKFKDLHMAGNALIGGTLGVTGIATFTAQPIVSSLTASRAVFSDGSKGLVSNAITGTGNVVMSASPTLTGTVVVADLTDSSLTAGRVTYAGTGGNLVDSANLTFNGTTLSAAGLSDSGNLAFTGTGNRITGDFSNATIANRVAFQTSTVNGATAIGVLPNGTSTVTTLNLFAGTDTANASIAQVLSTNTEAAFRATISGAGTFLPMTFYTGGSERVRIDTSGNVGIGVTTVNGKLDVKTASDSKIIFNDGSTTGNVRLEAVNVAYSAYRPFETNGSIQLFATGGTERMRIDSSGQVGIGFTPQSTQGNLQVYKLVSGGAPATSGTTDANQVLGVNGGYVQTSFGVYASGTGWIQQRAWGNFAVNYSLVLQPNGGNLGVGVSAPTTPLDVQCDGSAFGLQMRGRSSDNISVLRFVNSAANTVYGQLDVRTDQFIINAVASVPMVFFTGNTERARIDSSGNLLVGTTASINVAASNAPGAQMAPSGILIASNNGAVPSYIKRYTSTGNLTEFYYGTSSVGYISTNGSTVTFSGNALSDARWKENVKPIESAISSIMLVEFVGFDYKDNKRASAGVTAQQLETVPELSKFVVSGANDEDYKTVDYNALVGYLGKAIQELKAEFDAYKATHP